MVWRVLFILRYFIFQLGKYLFAYHEVTAEMYRRCDKPRNRIGNIEAELCMIHLEYCKHPHNAEHAGTEEGDYHRHNCKAETADCADKDVHHTADAVACRDDGKTVETIADNLRIRTVKTEEGITEKICAVAQD